MEGWNKQRHRCHKKSVEFVFLFLFLYSSFVLLCRHPFLYYSDLATFLPIVHLPRFIFTCSNKLSWNLIDFSVTKQRLFIRMSEQWSGQNQHSIKVGFCSVLYSFFSLEASIHENNSLLRFPNLIRDLARLLHILIIYTFDIQILFLFFFWFYDFLITTKHYILFDLKLHNWTNQRIAKNKSSFHSIS